MIVVLNIMEYFMNGYDIVDNIEIKTLISCGLGEDASFDVEILDKKECNVLYC